MGHIAWAQRISHFDRPLKRRHQQGLGLGAQLLKAEVKRRRGAPTRSFGSDTMRIVFDLIAAKSIGARSQSPADVQKVQALQALRDRSLLRSRMLERKRAAKRKVASRKVTAALTKIYLWKRRQEWLREFEDILVEEG